MDKPEKSAKTPSINDDSIEQKDYEPEKSSKTPSINDDSIEQRDEDISVDKTEKTAKTRSINDDSTEHKIQDISIESVDEDSIVISDSLETGKNIDSREGIILQFSIF